MPIFTAIGSLFGGGEKKQDQVKMPKAPGQDVAAKKAQEDASRRKKAISKTKSVRTSPLGLAGEATVAKKTLLGQ